ncbi:MAG: contractile injection system protein, VgrG/Pvc8 family, partial [Burkholderiales bacterium]|nr:contractile injection system protein, VgrG/Pvc8 family [Burkholderiales bacterium]
MNISKLANQVLSLLGDLGDWTQHQRVLRLNTPLGPNQLMAESFTGVESLSEGFKFEIIALSGNADIALSDLIGQAVLLELMTANASTELRPFHGHVTQVETLGSNGGLSRYKLIVEPWTAFMALRRDSTTYQDMSVLDILESIFKDYQGQGKLVPAWRLEIA